MTDDELKKEFDKALDKQLRDKAIGIRITKREYDEIKKSKHSFADVFRVGFNILMQDRFK